MHIIIFNGDKMLVKNQDYTIDISSVTQEGMGIGRVDGFVVFTYGALPGEKITARIIKTTKSYAIGKLLEIIVRSPERLQKPACGAYPKCGGCCFCHWEYQSQISFKNQYVRDCVERIGKIDTSCTQFTPTAFMENPTGYRNKYTYVFGKKESDEIFCGFYAANSHRVVELTDCIIETSDAKAIRQAVSDFANEKNLSVYDEKTSKGLLRNLMIRFAAADVCVIVIINGKKIPFADELIQRIRTACPIVSSVYININNKNTNVVLGEQFQLIYGKKCIEAVVGDCRFIVSPQSFFQINPSQTKVLYDKVYNLVDIKKGEMLYDLFCGTGTIGIYVKKCFIADNPGGDFSLIGVEYVPEAVLNAEENARINQLEDCRFFAGDATDITPQIISREGRLPDAVIVDPPRSGLDEKLLDTVIATNAKRIVYVSCNPSTMARDVKYLTAAGYRVNVVETVDMFPHTGHVESVVLLSSDKNTIHNMKLNPKPFEMIKRGIKTIELRLLDEKRRKIKPGDVIIFTNTEDGRTIRTTVLKLHVFDTFQQLYDTLPLLKCGYTSKDVASASASDMMEYYSEEEQRKYGVVGIEITNDLQIILQSSGV